jgi:hypothetical protein
MENPSLPRQTHGDLAADQGSAASAFAACGAGISPVAGSSPMLLKTVRSQRIAAGQLITHHVKLGDILQADDILGRAADINALKVIIEA